MTNGLKIAIVLTGSVALGVGLGYAFAWVGLKALEKSLRA